MRKTIFVCALLAFSDASAQNADSAKLRDMAPADTLVPAPVGVIDSTLVVPEYVAYLDSGIASWYGPNWEGRLTASGEYFSPDSMTAAHKWLPFGTVVKVTNVSNDSVIYVRITDRLPKSSKRSIDLTPVAAKRLGFYTKGLQKVRMESVGKTPVKRKTKSLSGRQ